MNDRWPELTLSEWEATRDTVQLWTQVVGILANESTAILTGTPIPSAPAIMQGK